MSAPLLTLGEVVTRTARYFAAQGSGTPRLDADLVIGHALGLTRLEVYTQFDRPLTPSELDAARALVARRAAREPVAYIVGRRGFRRLELDVGPAVLVPRPETEILVEWVVESAPRGGSVLDWGTGSGAIALAVADERPDLIVTAIDASPPALAVAEANARRLALDVEFVVSDGFAALAQRRFDVIAANPPYLSDADLAAAPPELAFEPRAALVAGPRGDEALASITAGAAAHLVPGGALMMEIGAGQEGVMRRLASAAGLGEVATRADLAGIVRTVRALRPVSRD